MFKNVLVALKEGTDHSLLLELAKKSAPAPATFHLATLILVGAHEDEPERLRASQAELDGVAEQLRRDGYDVATPVGVVAVAAGVDLVHKANDMSCDLVVIGLAKRSRVGKALMGSDAQRVLMSAECPVIVTRLY